MGVSNLSQLCQERLVRREIGRLPSGDIAHQDADGIQRSIDRIANIGGQRKPILTHGTEQILNQMGNLFDFSLPSRARSALEAVRLTKKLIEQCLTTREIGVTLQFQQDLAPPPAGVRPALPGRRPAPEP